METIFVPKELESRNQKLVVLFPSSGPAKTVEGEMLRAVNKIAYRYYNDGDYWWKGYGTETAGPPAAYLERAACSSVWSEVADLIQCSADQTGQVYERFLITLIETVVEYVEGKDGEYTENHDDMWKHEAKYKSSAEDWEDDEWEDD